METPGILQQTWLIRRYTSRKRSTFHHILPVNLPAYLMRHLIQVIALSHLIPTLIPWISKPNLRLAVQRLQLRKLFECQALNTATWAKDTDYKIFSSLYHSLFSVTWSILTISTVKKKWHSHTPHWTVAWLIWNIWWLADGVTWSRWLAKTDWCCQKSYYTNLTKNKIVVIKE